MLLQVCEYVLLTPGQLAPPLVPRCNLDIGRSCHALYGVAGWLFRCKQ